MANPNLQIIDNLDLPDGLKDQLANRGFQIEQLMAMKISDLAEKLGIDQDAARLIINALRRSYTSESSNSGSSNGGSSKRA